MKQLTLDFAGEQRHKKVNLMVNRVRHGDSFLLTYARAFSGSSQIAWQNETNNLHTWMSRDQQQVNNEGDNVYTQSNTFNCQTTF